MKKKKTLFGLAIIGIIGIIASAISIPMVLKKETPKKTQEKVSLITKDKDKFALFDQNLNKKITPISNGVVKQLVLTNLNGHNVMPSDTNGVNRTFSIATNLETGIATVTITFTMGKESDTTKYKISGFQTRIEIDAIRDIIDYIKNKSLIALVSILRIN